jgi:hypothetical protein
MGRKERRAEAARQRTGKLEVRGRREQRDALMAARDDLLGTMTKIADNTASIEDKLEQMLDAMANAVVAAWPMGEEIPDAARDAVLDTLQTTFKDTARAEFVSSKWRGCTEETIDQLATDEVIRRSMFRSDISLALSAIDRMALFCDRARKQGLDVVKAAHDGYHDTLGHDKSTEVRRRLLAAGFRGGVESALEDTLCSEICDNLDHVAAVARQFSLLQEFPKTEERMAGFMRRIEPELRALQRSDRVNRLGELTIEQLAQTALEQILKVDMPWPGSAVEFGKRYKVGPKSRASLLDYGWRNATQESLDRILSEEAFQTLCELRAGIEGRKREGLAEEMQADLEKNALDGKAALVPKSEIRCTAQSFDHTLMRVGADLWQATYARGMADAEAAKVCEADGRLRPTSARFAALWAVDAFQRLQCSHTFAAALMCTDVDAAGLRDAREGWHAFSVIVPSGLMKAPNEGSFEIRRILFAQFRGSAMLSLHDFTGKGERERAVFVLTAPTVAELLVGDLPEAGHGLDFSYDGVKNIAIGPAGSKTDVSIEHDDLRVSGIEIDGPEKRLVLLARRLTAGLLLATQHEPDVQVRQVAERPAGYRKGQRQDGEPAHRMVIVGRPLAIDCREGIESYIRTGKVTRGGRPGLPAVQWIVRGHYKHQVCGVGRLGRKLIWVKPHWKGKEDAPILTHARRVVVAGDGPAPDQGGD